MLRLKLDPKVLASLALVSRARARIEQVDRASRRPDSTCAAEAPRAVVAVQLALLSSRHDLLQSRRTHTMATIKVENLSKGTSNVTLEQFFSCVSLLARVPDVTVGGHTALTCVWYVPGSFCGKISNVERSEGDSSAVIHFVKESAAKTALLLDGGSLDGAALRVSSDDVAAPEHAQPTLSNDSAAKPVQETREPLSGPGPVEGEDAGVTQEDKPRSAIAGACFSTPSHCCAQQR